MVAPPDVVAAVLAHRDNTGTSPSAAGQRVLVELARHGDLGRHLRRLRRELSTRRELVVGALHAAGLTTLGDDAGAHVVVPLPSLAAEQRVVRQALDHGALLDGLARHHDGRPTWHGIGIGYTACTRQELLAVLPAVIRLLVTATAEG
jgi:GntR family transcriptional regulator/MocR family aminotransferase